MGKNLFKHLKRNFPIYLTLAAILTMGGIVSKRAYVYDPTNERHVKIRKLDSAYNAQRDLIEKTHIRTLDSLRKDYLEQSADIWNQ